MKIKGEHTRAGVVAAMFLLLAACGGGSGGSSDSGAPASSGPPSGGVKLQLVSFGDSLSDVGTYAPIASILGGGRFTTNPGQIWVQDVAQYYGGTVAPAFSIDLTQKLSPQGGFGFAEGGATVATPANQNDFLVDVIGDVEMPVTQQVASYLQEHGSFNGGQLVLVLAGANDVLRAGALPAGGTIVQEAAATLAGTVATIVANGATHVVVINVPNVGLSPHGLAAADGGATLTQESQIFNMALLTALQTDGVADQVIQIDSYTWLNQLIANYRAEGFLVSNTATACDPNKTPKDTALLCSPSTYVSSNADQTYIFADDLHFSTHSNTLLAELVESHIAASGLGH